jgi:hypothetical protein
MVQNRCSAPDGIANPGFFTGAREIHRDAAKQETGKRDIFRD